MNCRRVQKNLPLYVEGDLDRRTAAKIELHLEQCGRCNWLADEYKESQTWWRSDHLPEFDAARLSDIKSNVLIQIDQSAQSRSLLAALGAYFSRRYVFALAAAILILSAAAVMYVYQQRGKVNRNDVVAGTESPTDKKSSSDASDNKSINVASSNDSEGTPKRRNRSHIGRSIHRSQTLKPSTDRGVDEQRSLAASSFETVTAPSLSSGNRRDPDVLRIEIQTSDPKIRIIWFAPREIDSHQSKPATD
jgi:hypothetical protein